MAKSKKRAKRKRATKKPTPVVPERLKFYAERLDLPTARKRPRMLALLFCDLTNPGERDKINLLGMFDRIVVHPETHQGPPFIVFGRCAETTEEPLYLAIFSPTNKIAAELKFEPPAERTVGRTSGKDIEYPKQIQFFVPMQLQFHEEGTYWFDVSYAGQSLGGAGLVVEYRALEDSKGGTDTFI